MKEKGYVWNPKTFQYEPVNGEEKAPEEAEKQESNNGYTEQEILEVVMNNKDKLAEMLEMSEPETLPRYMVSGYKINKCIQLSHRLDAILKDFCQENNISQREIIEIGIIETLRKHGYQAEIKGLLGS